LIAAAFNDAVRKVESETKSMMNSIAGGLQMPAGFKFPF
jgi:DNA-binding protein YbaB